MTIGNDLFNPFNVRIDDQKFFGEIQPSSNPDFKQFISFPFGIRCGTKIILTYYNKYGLNTITEIISRWAPSSDGNDTNAYIAAVSRYMFLDANEAFKVTDPNNLKMLMSAIGQQENPIVYTPDDLASGIRMALLNTMT